LDCVSNSGTLCLAAGCLRIGCRVASAGKGLPKGWGDCFRSQLLLGGSLLPYALQMLSWSKGSSDWLTTLMWSTSLSPVASSARPNVCWHCCGLCWLASACFALLVDQKLVVGLQMRCRFPQM
jgi:hypothetical protein